MLSSSERDAKYIVTLHIVNGRVNRLTRQLQKPTLSQSVVMLSDLESCVIYLSNIS